MQDARDIIMANTLIALQKCISQSGGTNTYTEKFNMK